MCVEGLVVAQAYPPPTPRRCRCRRSEKVVYYRIANHYRFILRTFFDCFAFQRLIILEVGAGRGCAGGGRGR